MNSLTRVFCKAEYAHQCKSQHLRVLQNAMQRLSCAELLLGMFVFELDCAGSKTPFAMGGFHLKNVEDIETLIEHCKHVVIDTNKSVQPRKGRKDQPTILSSARKAAPESGSLKIDRSIVSSYRSQNSSKRLGDGRDLDPRN